MGSINTVPANAIATTSGGDIKKFASTSGWTRPSKLRFPDNTDAATISCCCNACSILGAKGPELPTQVVQP